MRARYSFRRTGWPARRKRWEQPGEADKLHLLALSPEGDEVLLTLLHGASHVVLAVEEEHGRLHVGGVGERRVVPEGLLQVPPCAAPLDLAEADADVGGAVHAVEVDAGRADDGGLEAGGVADDPACHEAAVAVAVDAQPVRVDVGALAEVVDGGHDVEVVLAAPVLLHGDGEVGAVGGGAAGVDQQHEVAGGSDDLLEGLEGVIEGAVGAAVNVDDEGVAGCGVEARREEKAALDVHAAAGDGELLDARGGVLPEVVDVLAGELGDAAACDVDAVEVAGGGGGGSEGDGAAAGGVDGDVGHLHAAAGDAAQLAGAHLDLAEVGLALGVADEDDAAVGGPAQVGGRGDGGHAAEGADGVGGEAFRRLALGCEEEGALDAGAQDVAVGADEGEALAVGRPGEAGDAGEVRRPELGVASIDGDDIGLAVGGEVPVVQAGGGEGDARAVGGPGGHVVVPVAVGELAGVAACDVDDEGVPVGVAAPADGVAAVLDAADDADSGLLLVVVVVGGLVRVDVCDVGHAGGVGRPGELGDACGGGGEAAGLAAVGGDEPDLAAALVVGSEEGDGGTVGGEAGCAVLGAGGERAGLAIGQGHDEDLGAGLAGLTVDPGAGEGEAGAVWGDGGVGDGGELVDDVRGDGAGHGTPPGGSGLAVALYHSRGGEGGRGGAI